MEKIQLDIQINAPAKTVWDALWKDKNFRKWTSAFCAGSYAKSDWEEGSPIQFLDPKGDGMYSIIETKIPYQQMTFKHLGEMKQYEEKPKDWAGLKEAYFLTGDDTTTNLHVEMDATPELKKYMEETFPKALQLVKEISEQSLSNA